MPSEEAHLQGARLNRELAVSLLATPTWISWSLTPTFYCALHLVDAYLARSDIHPRNHSARSSIIKASRDLSGVLRDYERLQEVSNDARYELRAYTLLDVERFVSRQLARIERHVETLLGRPIG